MIRKKALLLIVTALMLGGCGQKGPLFLPDQKAEQQQK